MIELDSKIVEVTVYTDRARVIRRGSLSLDNGIARLGIPGLPLTLNIESVRAAARGTAQARLLGLEIESTFTIETPSEQIQQLEEQIESLQDEINAVDAQIELARHSRANLAAISSQTDNFALALAAGEMALADQLALFASLRTRMGELDGEIQERLVQRRKMQRQLEKLVNELKRWQGVPRRESYTALVEVEVLSPGDLAVELTYTVSGVSWQPIYDLRLVETGEAQPVLEVDYLAQVTQRSGEAWQDITLALSTARPALAGRLPQLDPWFIGLLPPPIIHADMAAMPAPMAAPMRAKSIQAAPVLAMEEAKADNLEAEIETQGAAVTYRIPANVSIPADGAPHKVAVTNLQFEPQLDFVTAPKLVDAVYRRAKVTNNSPFTFLPGAANLFAGSEFIGTMRQEMIPPQGKIELFLGVDDRVKVKRELKRREVDKKLIGSKRRIAYGYEITVENLLPRQARLTLHDQFPVSKHEDIKVRLEDVNPQPAEQSELHLLKWEFDLAAQEKRQVRFDFSVEYPPVLDVVGLP